MGHTKGGMIASDKGARRATGAKALAGNLNQRADKIRRTLRKMELRAVRRVERLDWERDLVVDRDAWVWGRGGGT